MLTRPRLLLLALLPALLAVPSPAAAAVHFVNVERVSWTPAALTIRPNDTVTWSFGNALDEHTITSNDDASDWVEPVDALRSCETSLEDVARTFPKPGEFLYQCAIHENMKGSIRVAGGAALPGSGVSTQGRNAQCPPPGLPLTPPPPTAAPATPDPGAPAPLVNTIATPIAPAPSINQPARPAAVRGVGVRALRGSVRVRFSLARRATVSVSIRRASARRVVRRVTLRRLRVGANSVRVPLRGLRRGRYVVDVAAGATVVRRRLTLR